MKNLYSLAILFTFLNVHPASAEDVNIDYVYSGDHNTDFSNISVSLKIGEFDDDRESDPRQIADNYLAEAPLTDIIRGALVQGLEHGGASLVEASEDMQITGRIVSSQMQLVDRGGVESIQLTIRTQLALQGGGRTIWETTLFGRGTVPISEGITGAVRGALDRTIRELVNDDYFVIELQ